MTYGLIDLINRPNAWRMLRHLTRFQCNKSAYSCEVWARLILGTSINCVVHMDNALLLLECFRSIGCMCYTASCLIHSGFVNAPNVPIILRSTSENLLQMESFPLLSFNLRVAFMWPNKWMCKIKPAFLNNIKLLQKSLNPTFNIFSWWAP